MYMYVGKSRFSTNDPDTQINLVNQFKLIQRQVFHQKGLLKGSTEFNHEALTRAMILMADANFAFNLYQSQLPVKFYF